MKLCLNKKFSIKHLQLNNLTILLTNDIKTLQLIINGLKFIFIRKLEQLGKKVFLQTWMNMQLNHIVILLIKIKKKYL